MSEQESEMAVTAAGNIIRPTPDEDAAINAQIAADPDDFELDDDWFENAKPTKELFPETYRRAMQRKADLEVGVIQNFHIALPAHVVAWFKAQASLDDDTGGAVWIELIEQTLQAYVSSCTASQSQSPDTAHGKALE